MIKLKQTCYGRSPLGCEKSWSEEKQKRREKEPWWKRSIESDITNLKRDINRLERERQGETGGKGKRKIEELYAK